MGNNNSSFDRTDIETNILQSAVSNCTVNAKNEANNNTFINTSVDQKINIGYTCTMNNQFDAQISNIITDTVKQTATTENGIIFPSFGNNSNTSVIDEHIASTITQIMSNNCSATFDNSFDNNVDINGGKLNQTLSGTADCAISNLATAASTNTVSNTTSQTAAITNALTTIILGLAICGTIGAIGVAAFSNKNSNKTISTLTSMIKK
jgi:citrate lyase gamma subunit